MLDQYHFFITADICTCIFCVFLLLMIYSRENLRIRRTRLFTLLVMLMLGASVSELLVSAVSGKHPQIFLESFSHLLRLTCPFVFLLYLLELTGALRAVRPVKKAIFAISELFLLGEVTFQAVKQTQITSLEWI